MLFFSDEIQENSIPTIEEENQTVRGLFKFAMITTILSILLTTIMFTYYLGLVYYYIPRAFPAASASSATVSCIPAYIVWALLVRVTGGGRNDELIDLRNKLTLQRCYEINGLCIISVLFGFFALPDDDFHFNKEVTLVITWAISSFNLLFLGITVACVWATFFRLHSKQRYLR